MKNLIQILILLLTIQIQISAQAPVCGVDSIAKQSIGYVVGEPIIPEIPDTVHNSQLPPALNPLEDNDRVVFWLHGFGGDANSWGQPADASQGLGVNHTDDALSDFPARRMDAVSLDYNTVGENQSIRDAVEYIDDFITSGNNNGINEWGIDPVNNFMIAHSEGGIVARDLERFTDASLQKDKIGGLMTFGTSHGGARIMNNKAKINQLAEDACYHLLKPFSLTFINKAASNLGTLGEYILEPLKLILLDPLVEVIENKVEPLICGSVLPLVIGTAFAGQLKPIGDDYKVGASVITALGSYQTEIPKVLAYGVESDNQIWRILHSMLLKKPVDYDLFEATDDDVIIAIAQIQADMQAQADYFVNNQYYNHMNWYMNQEWILEPLTKIGAKQYVNKAKKNRDLILAGNAFLGTMNDRWLSIIGARVIEFSEVTVVKCVCTKSSGGIVDKVYFPVDEDIDCDDRLPSPWNCNEVVTKQQVLTNKYKPNDGVVTNESSLQFPGVNRTMEMKFSNHMQMRNDGNTKTVLTALYEGEIVQYFKTKTRN